MKNSKGSKGLSIFMAVLLVLTAVLCVITNQSNKAQEVDDSKANWMKDVSDSTLLSDMSIPGTHDSGAVFCYFTDFSKCQSLTIADQLRLGIRAFDIRGKQSKNGLLSIHSVDTNRKESSFFSEKLMLSDIVSDMKEFLLHHKSETILFLLKEDSGKNKAEFFKEFVTEIVQKDKSLWYTKNTIPTMKQARGKIVLLSRTESDEISFENDKFGIDFSSYPYQGDKDEIQLFKMEISTNKNKAALFVQDEHKLTAKKKLSAIKTYLDTEKKPLHFDISFCSSSAYLIPRIAAKKINPEVCEMLNSRSDRVLGMVFFDFADKQTTNAVIAHNFLFLR